jgi:2-polyprenyl-3-methyl-5-hydroxy-6-metoxy-1,4-benzoquinol methylase
MAFKYSEQSTIDICVEDEMVEDSTVSCYSDHSRDYDVYQSAVIPHYQEMLDMVALTCSRYLGQSGSSPRILDLGCGTGNASIAVLEKIPAKIFLFDGSRKMVDIALEKINSRFPSSISGHKVADLSSSDWSDGLGSGEYDAIVSTLVLEHLPFDRYRAVLEACYNLLTPEGWLFAVEAYQEEDSDMLEWFNQEKEEGQTKLDPRMSTFVTTLRAQKEIHYYSSKCQKENWWRSAGFEGVNVLWQYLCIAMMIGRKHAHCI